MPHNWHDGMLYLFIGHAALAYCGVKTLLPCYVRSQSAKSHLSLFKNKLGWNAIIHTFWTHMPGILLILYFPNNARKTEMKAQPDRLARDWNDTAAYYSWRWWVDHQSCDKWCSCPPGETKVYLLHKQFHCFSKHVAKTVGAGSLLLVYFYFFFPFLFPPLTDFARIKNQRAGGE